MCSVIWWVLCWWPAREPTVVSEPRSSSSARRGREGEREIRERSTGAGNKAAGSDLHSAAERHLKPQKRRVTECLQSCRQRTLLRAGCWLAVRKHTHTHTDGEIGKTPVSPCMCVCLWEKEKQDCTRRKTESWVTEKYQTLNKHICDRSIKLRRPPIFSPQGGKKQKTSIPAATCSYFN